MKKETVPEYVSVSRDMNLAADPASSPVDRTSAVMNREVVHVLQDMRLSMDNVSLHAQEARYVLPLVNV